MISTRIRHLVTVPEKRSEYFILIMNVDNLCKQFGPRLGSKLFETLMVFLNRFFFFKRRRAGSFTFFEKKKVFACALTLYSTLTPFDAFEISCIRKYFGKWSICSFGANAPFSIIFSKVFKT